MSFIIMLVKIFANYNCVFFIYVSYVLFIITNVEVIYVFLKYAHSIKFLNILHSEMKHRK